jgi:hypothetical protein
VPSVALGGGDIRYEFSSQKSSIWIEWVCCGRESGNIIKHVEFIEWKQQNHRMALPDTTVTAPRSSPASAAATRRDVRRVTSSSLALPLAPGARIGERASRKM